MGRSGGFHVEERPCVWSARRTGRAAWGLDGVSGTSAERRSVTQRFRYGCDCTRPAVALESSIQLPHHLSAPVISTAEVPGLTTPVRRELQPTLCYGERVWRPIQPGRRFAVGNSSRGTSGAPSWSSG